MKKDVNPWEPAVSMPEMSMVHLSALLGRLGDLGSSIRKYGFCDEKDSEGFTPLHRAVEGGDRDCVRLLLAYGASPETTNSLGLTPYAMALEFGRPDIAELFVESPKKEEAQLTSVEMLAQIIFDSPDGAGWAWWDKQEKGDE